MKSSYGFGRSALAAFLLCALSALRAHSQECVDPDGSVELDAEIRNYERVLVLDQNSLETANKGLGAGSGPVERRGLGI